MIILQIISSLKLLESFRCYESSSRDDPSRGRYGIPLLSNSSRTSSGNVPFTLLSAPFKCHNTSQHTVQGHNLSALAISRPMNRQD